MKLSQKIMLVILVSLVILIGVYALDFKITKNTFEQESQIGTFAIGLDNNEKLETLPKLGIYIDGPSFFAQHIYKTLSEELNQPGGLAREFLLLEEPLEQADMALLVVKLDFDLNIWTPVYSLTNANIDFAFASDGDLTWWQEDEPVFMSNTEFDAIVRMDAQVDVQHSAFGLMSCKGYHDLLAEKIGAEIHKDLQEQILRRPLAYHTD
jgi:hypothetical protein